MTYHLAVIGLGYVGLPLVREATSSGLSVVGLDVDASVVGRLADGRSHVDDVSDADVATMLAAGFRPTTDASALGDAEAVVICVPTPLSAEGGPDLSMVRAAVDAVAAHLRPGQLVVLESTTSPGTTEEMVRPALEARGLSVGTDVHLAFSPERIDPGSTTHGFRTTPKVVGGCTPACTRRAADLYGRLVDDVVLARSPREAEMSKLLENTYRHVNIALVNETAKVCHELGIDVWDVIRCASTKPFGFQAFRPGPGVGGHCIPIDPTYLSHAVRAQLGSPFRSVELAQEINQSMPAYVARRVQDMLNDGGRAVRGSRVLVVGTTYKTDIRDQRESPALGVVRALRALGADLQQHDSRAPDLVVDGEAVPPAEDLLAAAAAADVVVVLQVNSDLDAEALVSAAGLVLDARGALPEAAHVVRL
ncbi:nucleotide sugar dehydrogenase [uncultured Pseudokineococcus sp.]|uniref:nucleotide sugar dehydrogenase n=1 Tax=uncultured Pseudokineococcus sp. TaxID=1642928 RepID=UPI002616FD2F|nr:nucleotide sugar dehydrogenase [uncultured Pseudokineococcus sp.]